MYSMIAAFKERVSPKLLRRFPAARLLVFVMLCALAFSGCNNIPGVKRKVTVPVLLTPLAKADTTQLISEVNRLATVQSLRGKIDVQFLDTSFAKCGVADKYATAEGDVTLQRPGQVYLVIQAPFGIKIAEMTSDGERFRVAVLQGDERYKRFVQGTNAATYAKLQTNDAAEIDCGDDDEKLKANQQRTVSALSGLRPQHFTDALLIRPAAESGSSLTYARSEFFQEEPDERPNAKRGARVVRSYYLLDELAPGEGGQAILLRRFWFDRFENINLARLQTFDNQGQLITDVVYKNPQPVGTDNGQTVTLPTRIDLTRPQDRYSIRLSYQTPGAVELNRTYEPDRFVLLNRWQLPEVDLDKE